MSSVEPHGAGDELGLRLEERARRRIRDSIDVPTEFFSAHADEVARACLAMARRFQRGGRLLPFGQGGCATDAYHVSVEFVHPVIVGKRALPSMGLTHDVASASAVAVQEGPAEVFTELVRRIGRPPDIALGVSPDGGCAAVVAGLRSAREHGLLTVGLAGGDGGRMAAEDVADFCFVVPSHRADVVQEVQETLYHVLWELVHVFFEHRELLDSDEPPAAAAGESP